MTPADMIDAVERRGTITYLVGDEVRTMRGHFVRSLNGRGVAARKIRGRNRWALCSLENVVGFVEEVAS